MRGGDELQGIKRGIMELADVIVVNKADGDLLAPAQRAASDLRMALHLLRPKRPGWTVEVLLASALEGTGVTEAWDRVLAGIDHLRATGTLEQLRGDQAVAWMWDEVREGLLTRALGTARQRALAEELAAAVSAQQLTPGQAAARLLGDADA